MVGWNRNLQIIGWSNLAFGDARITPNVSEIPPITVEDQLDMASVYFVGIQPANKHDISCCFLGQCNIDKANGVKVSDFLSVLAPMV